MTEFHPLSEFSVVEVEGNAEEVMNSWAFWSLLWQEIKKNNPNARGMVLELFTLSNNAHCLDLLLKRKDESSNRQAIAELRCTD